MGGHDRSTRDRTYCCDILYECPGGRIHEKERPGASSKVPGEGIFCTKKRPYLGDKFAGRSCFLFRFE